MNLRNFKKDVEYFVGDFIDDCSQYISLYPGKATDEVAEVIEEAVNLYNDLKDKANVKIEGRKSIYFASLRKEMLEGVDALYEKLSKIITGNNAE